MLVTPQFPQPHLTLEEFKRRIDQCQNAADVAFMFHNWFPALTGTVEEKFEAMAFADAVEMDRLNHSLVV